MTIELHNNVYCEGEGIPVVLVQRVPRGPPHVERMRGCA